jgi:hypothetical protein
MLKAKSSFKNFIKVSFLIILLLFLNASLEKQSGPPILSASERWFRPLEIKAGLSSVFGDFRETHIHSGIDFRTNGQIGYKVFAVDDGVIYRLSVRKRGFGKALYIRHGDGIESVYAHLDRFEEEELGLETFLRRARQSHGTKYPGDLFLERLVRRGQLIAFSGETGAGLPHLHFELRRGGGNPLDPFSIGFRYLDEAPPVIEKVVIEPVGSNSYLEGEHDAKEFKFDKAGSGYTLREIPTVSGWIQFKVAMYDQIGAENHCSVQDMQLSVDGKPLYTVDFDTFTFKTNHRVGLIYDFNKTRYYPAQFYYKLYNPYDRMPYSKDFSRNGGIWDTTQESEGFHTLDIQAGDAAGHKTMATFKVKVVREEGRRDILGRGEAEMEGRRNAETRKRGDGLGHEDTEIQGRRKEEVVPASQNTTSSRSRITVGLRNFRNFIEVVVLSTASLNAFPEITVQQQGGKKVQIPVRQTKIASARKESRFVGTYDLIPGLDGPAEIIVSEIDLAGKAYQIQQSFLVQTIFAQRGGTASWGEKTTISFPPGALYEDTFINIVPETDYEEEDDLPVASSVYGFHPYGTPLEERATVRIQYPFQAKDLKKLGVYRWNPFQKKWDYMDDRLNPSRQTISAKVNFLSAYAVRIDNAIPVISDLRPAPGSKVKNSLSEISAIIEDRGKGVDEDAVVMELDGVRVDAEYDPDRNKAAYSPERRLSAGKHTLRVQASDLAGNRAVPTQSEFWVEP